LIPTLCFAQPWSGEPKTPKEKAEAAENYTNSIMQTHGLIICQINKPITNPEHKPMKCSRADGLSFKSSLMVLYRNN